MRPQTLHVSKSFSRLDSPRSNAFSRSRASTLQNEVGAENTAPEAMHISQDENSQRQAGDTYKKKSSRSGLQSSMMDKADPVSPQGVPEGFDELPIELISLTDRYECNEGINLTDTDHK